MKCCPNVPIFMTKTSKKLCYYQLYDKNFYHNYLLENKESERLALKFLFERVVPVSYTEYLVPCIIALGLICDTRFAKSKITQKNENDVKYVLYSISDYCRNVLVEKYDKSRIVALKLINGESLSSEEEQYLLTKLEQ